MQIFLENEKPSASVPGGIPLCRHFHTTGAGGIVQAIGDRGSRDGSQLRSGRGAGFEIGTHGSNHENGMEGFYFLAGEANPRMSSFRSLCFRTLLLYILIFRK